MPSARPMPKKHLTTIQDSLADLKRLAQRLGHVIENLERGERQGTATLPTTLPTTLRELQGGCYAVALRLAEIEIAEDCSTCPCAPAQTATEVYLTLLSQKLRQLSEEMWQTAQGAAVIYLHDDELAN